MKFSWLDHWTNSIISFVGTHCRLRLFVGFHQKIAHPAFWSAQIDLHQYLWRPAQSKSEFVFRSLDLHSERAAGVEESLRCEIRELNEVKISRTPLLLLPASRSEQIPASLTHSPSCIHSRQQAPLSGLFRLTPPTENCCISSLHQPRARCYWLVRSALFTDHCSHLSKTGSWERRSKRWEWVWPQQSSSAGNKGILHIKSGRI